MALDEDLFFARRLGYGLRQGETLGSSVRDWATAQIASIPPLDFYGPGGTNIRADFPAYAEPVTDFGEATRLWGYYFNLEHKYMNMDEELAAENIDALINIDVNHPRYHYPYWRDCMIRSLTAVNGPSPVFERFWSFWVNHFTVNAEFGNKLLYGPHTRAIRNAMTGKFNVMLREAILNPAMLFYLDNFLSTGPNSESAKYGSETINENLARELLELHTMSPAAGYTQADIVQTSYALTGWGLYGGKYDENNVPGASFGVRYSVDRHEPGERTIMGKTYSSRNRGMNQAPLLIDDLAADPRTASFLSLKLLRHFLADEPPADAVQRVTDAWMQSGGDMVTIHTAVIDEVIAHGPKHVKFANPDTWLYQMHRSLGADLPKTGPNIGEFWINVLCEELGQSYNECPQPNGWSDLNADWVSKELLERRVRYAYKLGTQLKSRTELMPLLVELATRLTGADSDLTKAVSAAPSPMEGVTMLFSSPAVMRI